MSPVFDVNGFTGVVLLKDWMKWIDNRAYMGVLGTVTIIEVEQAIGFEPGKGEANWLARVEGGEAAHNIPGCQIRNVVWLKRGIPPVVNGDILVA